MLVLSARILRAIVLMAEKGETGLAVTELFTKVAGRRCPKLLGQRHREFLVNRDAAL
jgi:hypothetical protein